MNRLLISAAHKSSGKTTLSIGLCAALSARGLAVQPFKKGPDYIDPMWLGLAAKRDCHNLDFYLMSREEILDAVSTRARDSDVALIEGNKGLYDGLDLDGSNSNAALAVLLGAPVVLVIDARGMTRGIAPLILGYQAFDKNVRIAGVILNQLGGARHESKLRAVIEHYTDVPVIGAVHHDERLGIVERHLGLMPSNESGAAQDKIRQIAQVVGQQVDLDRIMAVARGAPALDTVTATSSMGKGTMRTLLAPPPPPGNDGGVIRLGIARDEAFGFYYPGDLEALRAAGAELVPFNTLRERRLPDVDALFIGGGFPEVHIEALAANAELRRDIRNAIEAGLPCYAECGGLMYLARRLRWGDREGEMVGVIPGDVVMHDKPQGRGYARLLETGNAPWPLTAPGTAWQEIPVHEFHYSSLENLPPDIAYAYEMKRGYGVDGRHDGIVYKNLLACYCHMRNLAGNRWAERFVSFARRHGRQPTRARGRGG
jgi:cobyrinic acid a,c-diamide synthase